MQRYFLVRQRIPWKKLLFCLNFAVLVCTVGVTHGEAGSYSAVLRCRNGSGFSTVFLGGWKKAMLIRIERKRAEKADDNNAVVRSPRAAGWPIICEAWR